MSSPNAPLSLTVVSITSSTAVLSWAAATSGGLAANYGVQVSPHGAGIWATVATASATLTGSTVTDLSRDTAYDFQVLASNAAGTGPASAIAAGGTDNGYPIWTNVWGVYLHTPAAPGTYYVWALVHDGSGGLVSAAIAVT